MQGEAGAGLTETRQMVCVVDTIALIEQVAKVMREQLLALSADLNCDSATRVEGEVASVLTKVDEVALQKLRELRNVAGHA
jgi:hypothetical protein